MKVRIEADVKVKTLFEAGGGRETRIVKRIGGGVSKEVVEKTDGF